ncbi:MAG TPA: acyltransferase [Dyella sp.]|uniref:acyltransferase family protein n=1 Tax=Dyella sp. TaxID=1869338 RepID=UPI002CC26B14|nr:acyltransferase [Dyella sp.]HTV84702.1 acyltransferase [Dyella sp.]
MATMRSASPAQTAPSPNTDIECLRALAVIGVVIHHMQGNLFYPNLPLLTRLSQYVQTWCGVDLFFAISGFVIARSLLPPLAAASGNMSTQWQVIAAFWIRRAWRLLPSAWLWLALMLLASIVANRSGAFQSVHANLMATAAGVFNVANIRFGQSIFRYFYGASFVYWSLSLEEQFYLVLPWLVVCLRRYFPWVLAILLAIQLPMDRSIMMMQFRTDALGLGVLLAMASRTVFYTRIEPRILGHLRGSGAALLVLALSGMALLAKLNPKHSSYTIGGIAIIATVLVWMASYNANYLVRQGWLKRALVWVGNRSYAIYLCHVPIFFLLREYCFRLGIQHAPAWQLSAAAAVLIAVTAALNFRYVEQPLRRHGREVARQFLARRKNQADAANIPASDDPDNRAAISA